MNYPTSYLPPSLSISLLSLLPFIPPSFLPSFLSLSLSLPLSCPHSGQFWNFTVENPQENCLHDNETEVANCTVFFSVCKPLPASMCGGFSNVSYCQVVTSTNGTEKYFNIGSYTSKHNYITLSKLRNANKFNVH